MVFLFYLFIFLSIFFAFLITQSNNLIYSLLYLVLLSCFISGIFFVLGAVFIGALEAILYAGSIIVLFIFSVMLIQKHKYRVNITFKRLNNLFNILFFLNIFLVLFFLIFEFMIEKNKILIFKTIETKLVSLCLFSKYIFLVEFSSLLLLSAVFLVCFFLKE